MKNNDLTLGQIEAIVNKLGGIDNAMRLLRGEMRVLQKDLPVWKTIQIGAGIESLDTYLHALEQKNMKLTREGEQFLKQEASFFDTEFASVEVDLVLVSAKSLGCDTFSTYTHVVETAFEYGLEYCSMAAALELRLQYSDQPCFNVVETVMRPVTVEGKDIVLEIGHTGYVRWLSAVHADRLYRADKQFVFKRPRK